MIYPIIREDKKTGLLMEYIPESNYIAGIDPYEYTPMGHEYGSPVTLPSDKFDLLSEATLLLPPIAKQRQRFEPGYVFRYFILDDKTYVDVKVVSNINGDLELLCRGFRETYGEPRHFYDEKVVMGMTYYDKYIESVLKRFALKAIQL